MNLFYFPELAIGATVLEGEELRHLRVMRYVVGDVVHFTDGQGGLYQARIQNWAKHALELQVLSQEKLAAPLRPTLHLAIAPTKNLERLEWCLEKATEIGVNTITPLICQHSERQHLRLDRLEKVLIAAMKQSLQVFLPRLHPPQAFEALIQQPFTGHQRFIAYLETPPAPLFWTTIQPQAPGVVLIGPEGDFAPPEITSAKEKGFQAVSLGDQRLRTETAGVAAVLHWTLRHSVPPKAH